jgi:hypothetical protein
MLARVIVSVCLITALAPAVPASAAELASRRCARQNSSGQGDQRAPHAGVLRHDAAERRPTPLTV